MRYILAFILFISFTAISFGQSVVINEVMASNTNTIQDEDGVYSDWIELYNAGSEAVDLNNWGLTDLASSPFKWRFGQVTIQPGQFLIVWASNKNRPALTNEFNMLHAAFAISKGGEDIVLTSADSNQVDILQSTAMADDQSVGRKPDGTGGWNYFSVATPGASNSTVGIPATVAPPVFSKAGGVYTSTVPLDLSTSVTGGVIRYTLDGSEPTTNSLVFTTTLNLSSRAGVTNNWSMIPTNIGLDPSDSDRWQTPLGEVFKLHTVRARVFKAGSMPSSVITQSYLVDTSGTRRYNLPIISIASDSSNFFSDASGIYVPGYSNNYAQEGSAWERPASVEMINTNGQLAFRFDAGIRINGNTTRNRPRKALRVYARNPTALNYQLFPDKTVSTFNTFILRNAGNDWGQAIFRDAFLQTLTAHKKVDHQSAVMAVVFIDGEYWGVHDLRDRLDEGYFANHYGLDAQSYVQMESGWVEPNPSQPIYDKGNTNLVADYYDLLDFVNNQRVTSTNNYAALQERIDLDNYLDYMATEIWSGNTDWPGNNVKIWRSAATNREPGAAFRHDGRWRWMFADMDFALGLDYSYVPGHDQFASFNSLQHASAANGVEFSNNTNATLFFRRLLENNDFKRSFVLRFSDHLNSSFRTDRVQESLSNLVTTLAPGMDEHTRRWREPSNWSSQVARVTSYTTQRTTAVWGHLQSFFSLGNRTTLTVRVSDPLRGWVRVNSLDLKSGTPAVSGYPWSGSYFPDYPVELTAAAEQGSRFVGWRRIFGSTNVLLSTNLAISIAITNATDLRAEFEVDLSSVVPQPHNLANGPYSFTEWASSQVAGTYPSNMVFEQTATADPALATEMDSLWTLGYAYASQSRINGMGSNGVAFINTGSTQAMASAGFLGSAIVGLTTSGRTNIQVSWTGGTVTTNVRVQGLRLQYRVGSSGPFNDVLDQSNQPVEYLRSSVTGHSASLGPVQLPVAAENQPYVQLRWKYYFVSGASGARAQLRLDDILVTSQAALFPPVADAGDDQAVGSAGGLVNLDASNSYDPDGTISSYIWSQLSGPALSISNAPVITLSVPANPSNTTYVFQLVVTDNDGLSATDTVSVVQTFTALTANFPSLYFRGTANDWGTTPMTLISNYTWGITVTFNSAPAEFKFDVYGDWTQSYGNEYGGNIVLPEGAGTYRIWVNDDTFAYSVTKVQTPVANAGTNQTITLAGGNIVMNGSSSYDPDGSLVAYQWTQFAGTSAQISNSTAAIATAVLVPRATPVTNRFRLVVTDNDGLSATSTVSVIQSSGLTSQFSRLYFRGTPNNWTNNQAMSLISNNVWEIRVDFGSVTNQRFKFDTTQDWSNNYGDNNLDGIADSSGSNIPVTQGAGLYLIRFDDSSLLYTITRLVGGFDHIAQSISLSGTFNQWATPSNMTLVSDNLWQGVLPLFGTQSMKFVPDRNWSSAWGDFHDPESQNPATGIAEQSAPSIVITSALSGIYRVSFHETSHVYRIERLVIRAGETNRMTEWEKANNLDLLNSAARNADSDDDGLNNLVEALHGTNPNLADSDGDGQTDAEEIVAATDPGNPLSRFELLSGASLNWSGAVGRTYRVEETDSLETQNWQPVAGFTGIAGSNTTMQATPGATSEWQHLRVRITSVQYQPGE